MKITKEVKILSIVAGVVVVIAFGLYLYFQNEKEVKTATQAPPDFSKIVLKKAVDLSFSEGPQTAKVTVVEFFDPECETCAEVAPYIKNEIKYYQGKVRWVFRYMAYHPNSKNAIKILEAARKQNLYLEAMTLVLSKQSLWGAKHDGSDQNQSKEKELLKIISSLPGIDMKKLKVDMNDTVIDTMIDIDKQEGNAMGVTGTPTLFVNGKIIDPLNLDKMIAMIEAGLR